MEYVDDELRSMRSIQKEHRYVTKDVEPLRSKLEENKDNHDEGQPKRKLLPGLADRSMFS